MAPGFGGDDHRSHRRAHADSASRLSLLAAAASASVPRTPDAADLNGVWQCLPPRGIQDHPRDWACRRPGWSKGMNPIYRGRLAKNRQTSEPLTPTSRGARFLRVPRMITCRCLSIVQTPKYVTMVFEYGMPCDHLHRGNMHPEGPIDFWLGIRAATEGTAGQDVIHFNGEPGSQGRQFP